MASQFEQIYQGALGRQEKAAPVSPRMEPLMRRFYAEAASRPPSLPRLMQSLVELLAFLTSPEGRSEPHCRLVAAFVNSDDWETSWDELPEAIAVIIADMGMGLDDTFSHTEIASDFESTPEQLLERARELIAH